MAITYNVARCKRGYGVYVKALSGNELAVLRYRFEPEIDDSDPITGALPVVSGRLTRKPTKEKALQALKNIKGKPLDAQLSKIASLLMLKIAPKNKEIVKLKYFQLHREFLGKDIKHFTTQDKEHAEKLAINYAEIGHKSSLRETIGRNLELTPEQAKEARKVGETKVTIPYGLTGMCAPLKDQSQATIRRISQKRKRTTKLSFWNGR